MKQYYYQNNYGVIAPINAGPLPHAKFYLYRGRSMVIQPPKLSKFRIFVTNLPLGGDSFAVFLRYSQNCTRLQVHFKFLVLSLSGDKQSRYKHFPGVRAFSLKFSIAPSGETKDRIKKSQGVQKWDGPPLSPCQIWWGLWVAHRLQTKKCDVFCLLVTLLEVCDD